MAAIRHLEFAKIATLVKWPISACDSSSPFRNLHKFSNIALRYCQKDFQYGVRPPSWIWKISFFLSNFHVRNGNLYLCTKFYRNRLIHGWYMEIKLFSKWRPSAILNLRKLQFWSRDLYRHVILHLCSKFRVDRPIWRRDIAKKQFSIWRPSAMLNLKNFDFCQICMLRMKICISIPNLIEIG